MIRQHLWSVTLVLALLLAILAPCLPVGAQTSTTVEVDKVYLSAGMEGLVAIQVKNITDSHGLGGCWFTITYDPAVITVNEVRPGDPPFDGTPTASVVDNKVILYTDQIESITGPRGDIVVARLAVKAIAVGSTPLELTINRDGLFNTHAEVIPASVVNGLVTVAGAAAKLAFTTQPSPGNMAGTAFATQPVVAIQDVAGNTVPNSSAAVTMAITSGTGTSGAVLSGTTTVNAVNGVATFGGLSIDLMGTGYTLLATSSSLASATSNTFNVMGPATKLVFTTQPSVSNTAGVAFGTQPVVKVQDANGNTVTTSMAAVTVAITSGTGTSGAVLSGTTTVNAVNGVTTFSGLLINLPGSGYTLTATNSSLTSATSSAFNVAAGAAAKLVFTTQPTSSNTAGTAFATQPVVKIQDSSGNTVSTSAAVTLAITSGTGTGGATLSGTKTVNAVNGVATFSGLTINLVGSGYTLTASGGSLTPATSSAINVAVGAAAKLVFTTQPSNSTAGSVFVTKPVVTVQDAYGNTVTTSTATVTLALPGTTYTYGGYTYTSESNSKLSGTTTVTASSGVASFTYLIIDLPGSYSLTASSSGLTSATSSTFNVIGAPSKLAFSTQPSSNNTAGTPFVTQPVVTVQDANGNTVTAYPYAVTLAIGANPAGGTLSGTVTVYPVNGVATFSGLSINLAGSGYSLIASSGGPTPATSSGFNVVAGTAVKLAFTTQPGGAKPGSAFSPQPVVKVLDALGNVVTNRYATVTLAIGANPAGGTLSGTVTANAVNGVATFGGLSINLAGSGYILTASSSGLTPATSSAFSVIGAATKLVFTTQPSSSNTAATAFATQPVVKVQDVYGSTVTTSTDAVTLAITSGKGSSGAVLSGTKTVNVVNGVATFNGLSIDLPGNSYTLTASSGSLTQATSGAFNVAVGAAAKLAFTTQPSSSNTAGTAFATQPVVRIQDSNGNLVFTSTLAVTLTVTSGTVTSGATLSGIKTVNAVNGLANFSGLSIDLPGSYTLTASSGSLTPAVTSAFSVLPTPAESPISSETPEEEGAVEEEEGEFEEEGELGEEVEEGGDGGKGINIWLIIGPIIGLLVAGVIVYLWLKRRGKKLNPSTTVPTMKKRGKVTPHTTVPTLSLVRIASSNANPALVKVGDSVALTIVAREAQPKPTVTMAGHAAVVTRAGQELAMAGPHIIWNIIWTATYTMAPSDAEGIVPFKIVFSDLEGNPVVQVTATTDASSVRFLR